MIRKYKHADQKKRNCKSVNMNIDSVLPIPDWPEPLEKKSINCSLSRK